MRKLLLLFIPVLLLCGCSAENREYSDTQFIMDTICTIRIGGDNAEAASSAAFARIDEIADITDYYSADSEISAINNIAPDTPIPLSGDMYTMLKTALDVCKRSDGAFDITIAPLKDLWRISDGVHPPPADSEISAALRSTDYHSLSLDTDSKTLTRTNADCRIDLSGVAKGYAADCAAEIIERYGCEYAIIDLGGSILTIGDNPARKDGKWLVGIQKPFADTGEYSQTVTIAGGEAVVTAGSYQRFFEYDGRLYHHILNPHTGYPSDSGISGASIRSSSALLADCLSTACMVLGEQDGYRLANEYNAELFIEKQA